jgi:uncharacterized protein (DUF2249 family)
MDQSQTKPAIDVRAIPPFERHPRIFGMLHALSPGGAMLVTSDHDPRPLRFQIETNHPGQFDWSYQLTGPDVWQVEIVRLSEDGCGYRCGGH